MFGNKLTCFSGNHIIFFVLSIFCFFFSFFMSFIFITFSFSKNEKTSSALIKYCLVNSTKFFLYIKAGFAILFAIDVKYKIKDIIVFFLTFSSIFSVYFSYIEYSYQFEAFYKEKLFYYFSYINCFSAIILLITYLGRNKIIVGFIYVFFIFVLFLILFIFINPHKVIKLEKPDYYLQEYDIYYQLINLIRLSNQNLENRENIYNIISFYSTIINTNINYEIIYNLFKKDEKNEMRFFLLKYIETIFKKAINENKNSILLRVQYANFLFNNMEKFNSGYLEIYSLNEEMKNNEISYTMSQQFYIYRIKKKLEEKCLEYRNDKSQISIKFQINNFIKLIAEVARMYYEFWNILLKSNIYIDVKRLDKYGKKINNVVREIEKKYQSLSSMKLKNRFIFILYAHYLRDILNEDENSEKILSKELILGNSNDESIYVGFDNFDINDIKPSSNLQYLIASAESNGSIIKCSPDFCKKIGYTNEQLYGKKINLIIPTFLREEHNKILNDYFENNKYKLKNDTNKLLQSLIYFKTSLIYISPLFIEIYIIIDEDYTQYMMVKIDSEKDIIYNKMLSDCCHILTNNEFKIQNFTPNCLEILNLKGNFINVEILNYIKQFKEIKFNYLINHEKKIEGLYKKIKKYLFEYNYYTKFPEKIVQWNLNNKFFKICVKKIKMNEKLVGYIFIFEFSNEKEISQKDLYQPIYCKTPKVVPLNSFKITRKEKTVKTLKSENLLNPLFIQKEILNLNNDLIGINSNFIPEKDKIIDFNIDSKEYTFNNKISNSNKMNLEKILDYYNIINNQKEFNKENKEIEYSSSNFEDSSNSSSYYTFTSEESSNYSSSKDEKEIIKTDLSKISSNKIEDNYYNVKLSKIFLFGYDYKSNKTVEITNYNNQSKIQEIFEIETNKTNKIIDENKKKKENALHKKFTINVGKLLISPKIKKIEEKKIKKTQTNFSNSISKARLNKSVKILMISNSINFLIIFLIPLIFFFNAYKDKKSIKNLLSICGYLFRLIDYSGEVFYYSFQISILQNKKYININPSSSNILKWAKEVIYSKYNLILELLNNLSNYSILLSKKYQNLKKNYTVNLVTVTNQLGFNVQKVPVLNFIEEYAASVYYFSTRNESKMYLLSKEFFTILTNLQTFFTDGLGPYQQLYHNQYHDDRKSTRIKLECIPIIFSVVALISIIFIFIANRYVIIEKEKHIKYFFKISQEKLETIIAKCSMFMKLNLGIYNNPRENISIPKINMHELNNCDEEDSLLNDDNISKSNENNSYKTIPNEQKNPTIRQLNEQLNSKSSNFFQYQKEIFSILYLYVFLFFFIMYLFILIYYKMAYKLSIISNYIDIYEIIISHKMLIKRYFIYLRIYTVFSSSYQKIPTIQGIAFILESELPNSFLKNKEIIEYLVGNITSNNVPNRLKKLFNETIDSSICSYMDNYASSFGITCDQVGNNVAIYGLYPVTIYIFQSMIELLKIINEVIKKGNEKNYVYSELFYGSQYYLNFYPENKSLWEEYEKLDPFNVINQPLMKNLTVLIENIFRPSAEAFLDFIDKDIENIMEDMEKIIIICLVCYYFILILIFSLYIIPDIFSKNIEINKKRKMLILIPKDILPEIIDDKKHH